jgi:hypothetical protein
MKLAIQMQKLATICFSIMVIAFAIFFIGMVLLPPGGHSFEELPPLVGFSILIWLFFLLLAPIFLISSNVSRVLTYRALQVSGLAAEARVLKVWHTEMRINRSPVMRFLLEVRPLNQPSFLAETEQLRSEWRYVDTRPGTVIRIKYDPKSWEIALADTHKSTSSEASV